MMHTKRILSLVICCVIVFLMMSPMAAVKASADTEAQKGSRIIVSLGDSYSSGEGIEDFYDQNLPTSQKVKSQDWLAHRSENSWSGRLTLEGVDGPMSENRNENWYFVASSGAETIHLKDERQRKDYDIDGYKDYDYIDKQLDVFNRVKDKGEEAEYVTVTIGGNDADFAGVIETSAKNFFNPGKLTDKLSDVWNEFYYGTSNKTSIRDRIRQAYYDIHDAAGDQAKIIVAGYPKLLDPAGSGFLFTKSDAALINDSVIRFNDEIESIVKSCKADGMKICFVSVEEEFEGYGAYADNACINPVYITRRDEDLKGGNSAYSMHPNYNGAGLYAKCVQDKIDSIEADGGKSEWPLMTSSDERDIVVVLDTSGSMDGNPMSETKKASEKFINTILKEDASIGIVTYNNQSSCIADFCMNEEYLMNVVQNINSGGGTNMESGLAQAHAMLQESNAKKKIIVLMSDGVPNEGKTGDSLVEYANTIKEEGIYLYTLGFFGNMYNKYEPQKLLQDIASDGCHFEVDNADNLVYFFGDIADQINGTKYIYVRIACPVDVTVKHNGEKLCSVDSKLNTRTSFGSLTFEENENESESGSDNRIKVLRLKEGTDYDIQIEGNGRGYMDYTIGFMDDTGEYSDLRRFNNIKITKRTVIDTVAADSDSTVLNVDEDGDGKYDYKYKATENGRGEIVDNSYVIYIIIGGVALILVLVVVIIIVVRVKSKKKKTERRK